MPIVKPSLERRAAVGVAAAALAHGVTHGQGGVAVLKGLGFRV